MFDDDRAREQHDQAQEAAKAFRDEQEIHRGIATLAERVCAYRRHLILGGFSPDEALELALGYQDAVLDSVGGDE